MGRQVWGAVCPIIHISDVRIRIRILIRIRIQSILGWIRIRIQTLESWIRIRIQGKKGGFGSGFESGFKLLLVGHNPN